MVPKQSHLFLGFVLFRFAIDLAEDFLKMLTHGPPDVSEYYVSYDIGTQSPTSSPFLPAPTVHGQLESANLGSYANAMSTELHDLSEVVLSLDPADRLALANLLIDSVEEKPDSDWAKVWTDELRRRTAAADSREVRGRPWSEIRARLLRDLAGK